MKGIFNKALAIALLVSVSGMNAGIGETSMGYFRQGLNSVGKNVQQGLSYLGSFRGLNSVGQGLSFVGRNVQQNVGIVARSVGSSVKNHPYMSGIAAAVLAYEAGMRYFGLSNWTLSYGAVLLGKKVADRVRSFRSVQADEVSTETFIDPSDKGLFVDPKIKGNFNNSFAGLEEVTI